MVNIKKKLSLRIALCSASTTFLIMYLFIGLIVAEKNTLSVLQEKTERILYIENKESQKELHFNLFGEKFIINITDLYNFLEKNFLTNKKDKIVK